MSEGAGESDERLGPAHYVIRIGYVWAFGGGGSAPPVHHATEFVFIRIAVEADGGGTDEGSSDAAFVRHGEDGDLPFFTGKTGGEEFGAVSQSPHGGGDACGAMDRNSPITWALGF